MRVTGPWITPWIRAGASVNPFRRGDASAILATCLRQVIAPARIFAVIAAPWFPFRSPRAYELIALPRRRAVSGRRGAPCWSPTCISRRQVGLRDRAGQMLPPYDSIATLELTSPRLVDSMSPAEEVWCLGDSFHDIGRVPTSPRCARGTCCARIDLGRRVGRLDNGQSRRGADPRPLRRRDRGRSSVIDGLVLAPRGRIATEPATRALWPFPSQIAASRVRGTPRRAALLRCDGDTQADPACFRRAYRRARCRSSRDRARGRSRCAEALVPIENRLLRFPLAA